MNRLTETQRRWNTQSADLWRLAESHRRQVMQLIEANAPAPGGRVCVLGAGNCNDLDLPRLLNRFEQVALVDLDEAALRRAVSRQRVEDAAGLRLHGSCDLTGCWSDLASLPSLAAQSEYFERILALAEGPTLPALGQADVVVSTCVLSQLIQAAIEAIGVEHPRFLDLLAAIRIGHLRRMTALAAPGGRILLISDFVSSDSAPEIITASESELEALARRLLESKNFFHGTHPAVLASLWSHDPHLAAATANLRVSSPWRWNFGVRQYLVTAYQVERRQTELTIRSNSFPLG